MEEAKNDDPPVELPIKDGYTHPIIGEPKGHFLKKSVRGLGFTPEKREQHCRGRVVFECKKRPRNARRRPVNQDENEALAPQPEPCSFKAIIQVAPGKDKWTALQDVVPHDCGSEEHPSTKMERLHDSKEAYRKSSDCG